VLPIPNRGTAHLASSLTRRSFPTCFDASIVACLRETRPKTEESALAMDRSLLSYEIFAIFTEINRARALEFAGGNADKDRKT